MKTNRSAVASAYVGIDISKDSLDVDVAGQGPKRYANTAAGIAELVPALARLPAPVRLICEPGGGYERDLLEALRTEKIPVRPVNAARARPFPRARGLLAKTDAIAAAGVARVWRTPPARGAGRARAAPATLGGVRAP